MTTLITRGLEFDAGHRLVGHNGKCSNLHGHRYRVEVMAKAAELDDVGRVVDFAVLKDVLGGWLDTQWDHTFILSTNDPHLETLRKLQTNKPVFVMPYNPTAENMARYLLGVCGELFAGADFTVAAVTVHETPSCSATVARG